MSLDVLHKHYSVDFFDTHTLQVDETKKSVVVIKKGEMKGGVNPLSSEQAQKCIHIWKSFMGDVSIDHSLRENVAGNIASLQKWIEKETHPDEKYPFETEVLLALAALREGKINEASEIVCQLIRDGCSREVLEKLKEEGYPLHLTKQSDPLFLSELKAAVEGKNYDVVHFLLDENKNLPNEYDLYSVLMYEMPDIYLLEEFKKRGVKKGIYDDLTYTLRNNQVQSKFSNEEIKTLYQFAIDNDLYKQGSLDDSLIAYFRNGNEEIIQFLIEKGAVIDSFYLDTCINHLFSPDYQESNQFYDRMEKHLPLKPRDVLRSLYRVILSGNSFLFQKLAKRLQENGLENIERDDWEQIWRYIQFSQNREILDFAFEHFIFEKSKEFPLKLGIEMQDPVFVELVLEKGAYLPEQLETNCELAVELGNIKIVRQIVQKMFPEKHASEIEKQVIFLVRKKMTSEFETDANRLYLCQLLLQSGYPEGMQVLEQLKKEFPKNEKFLSEIQNDYWKWVPYIGHFNPQVEKELNQNYPQKTQTPYIERQVNYGHQMYELTKQTATTNPPTLREMILDNYARGRSQVARQGQYANERTQDALTRMVGCSEKGKLGIINSRYALYQNLCNSTWEKMPDQQRKKGTECEYTILYQGYTLTRCLLGSDQNRGWAWMHSPAESLKALWPEMEKIHQELIEMSVDPSNQNEVESFKKKLSEGYWLGCHLMITDRGNSQYFQNWLANMCIQKGFKPPISSNKYPLVDCIALCLPLEDFQENFSSYFDCMLEPQDKKWD